MAVEGCEEGCEDVMEEMDAAGATGVVRDTETGVGDTVAVSVVVMVVVAEGVVVAVVSSVGAEMAGVGVTVAWGRVTVEDTMPSLWVSRGDTTMTVDPWGGAEPPVEGAMGRMLAVGMARDGGTTCVAAWERGEAEGAPGVLIGLMLAVGGGSKPDFSDDTPLVDGLDTWSHRTLHQLCNHGDKHKTDSLYN